MLTQEQKLEFVDKGYLKFENAVPQDLIAKARRAMNHSIGEVGLGGEDLENNRSGYHCAELCDQSVISDLFNTPAIMEIFEDLMGEGNVQPIEWAKPYPRFPLPLGEEAKEPGGHIDGTGSGTNGTAKGDYNRGFTAFSVVYLADVPEPYSGNFTVWPGSHRAMETHFKDVGHEVLSNGMPKIDLPEPAVMVTGKAGDLVVAHHAMVHGACQNASPNTRLAVIARPKHVNVDALGKDAYIDIWAEWSGVQDVLEVAG